MLLFISSCASVDKCIFSLPKTKVTRYSRQYMHFVCVCALQCVCVRVWACACLHVCDLMTMVKKALTVKKMSRDERAPWPLTGLVKARVASILEWAFGTPSWFLALYKAVMYKKYCDGNTTTTRNVLRRNYITVWKLTKHVEMMHIIV